MIIINKGKELIKKHIRRAVQNTKEIKEDKTFIQNLEDILQVLWAEEIPSNIVLQ